MHPSVTSRGITPALGIGPASAGGMARRRSAAAHSPKFHAVNAPTTAANWWLLRVACQLRALNERNNKSRKGLNRHGGSVCAGAALLVVFARRDGLAFFLRT